MLGFMIMVEVVILLIACITANHCAKYVRKQDPTTNDTRVFAIVLISMLVIMNAMVLIAWKVLG